MESILQIIKGLHHIFEADGIDYAIIGAFAANFYRMEPRFTADLDILVILETISTQDLIKILERNGFKIKLIPESDPDMLLCDKGSIPIHLIICKIPYQHLVVKRKTWEEVEGIKVPVISLEDLLIHKLIAHRQKDLWDIDSIIERIRRLGLIPEEEYLDFWTKEWDVLEEWEKIKKQLKG
ncbi:MAG: hypothetical protein A3G93_06805 [Nitrospinae bacterium RIFCSPLOWO2_12_FULL_45_22]|nr:MAG: hypothetical protein A3G93_06805 [Nitrospinae bacterium RIFCSPLOWO2_12_FULL_45_22]